MTFLGDETGFPKLDTPFVEPDVKNPSAGRVISIPWYRFLIALWNRTGGNTPTQQIASGLIFVWPGELAALPSSLLLCDGSNFLINTFPSLFAAIGTKYGATGGPGTFNVPNYVNRVVIGAGGIYPLAGIGGAVSHSLIKAELATHTHVVDDPGHVHAVTDPGHIHAITDPGHVHVERVVADGTVGTTGVQGSASANTTDDGNTKTATTGITVGSHTTGLTVDSHVTGITLEDTGAGQAFSILNPYVAGYPVIQI